MNSGSEGSFRAAHAAGAPWPALAKACLESLMPLPEGTTLGFLYVTDALAGDLSDILAMLRGQTRISDWVGSVGLGICAAGVETFEEPGLAVMVGAVPAGAFHVFAPISDAPYRFDRETTSWMVRRKPVVGVVHVDPRRAALDDTVAAISAANSTYLVGGITSARQLPFQVAGGVVEGGVSGVLLASEIAVQAGLSQGCSPLGPTHRVTEARGSIVITIDGRPAIDVLKEEIGHLLSRDLRRVPSQIFVGFPIAGSESGDYIVRDLVSINPERDCFSVSQAVTVGNSILFCRRDAPSAVADLRRMLSDVKQHTERPPRGGTLFQLRRARGEPVWSPFRGAGSHSRDARRIPAGCDSSAMAKSRTTGSSCIPVCWPCSSKAMSDHSRSCPATAK